MSDLTSRPVRIAAMISGGGRTLMNLMDHIDRGDLNAEIVCVIASREDVPGVARARARGLEVHIADPRLIGCEDACHDQITHWLDAADVDLVALCGWLRWLRIDDRYRGRVINIHPSLLPKFGGHGMYGDRVHQAVIDAGETESGCTVHWVDDLYDHGSVILQRRVPVLPGDTVDSLASRVFEQECIAYPMAIRQVSTTLSLT